MCNTWWWDDCQDVTPNPRQEQWNEQSAQSIKEITAEYKIDNKSVLDILDQIFKDTDLYPYVW